MKLISYGMHKEGHLTIISASYGKARVEWAVKGEVSLDDALIYRLKLTKQLTESEEINHVPE